MKAIIVLLIYFLAVLHTLYGQEGQLVLTNKSNAKEHTIVAGKKVSVYIDEFSCVKGKLLFIDSTSISIGKDTIPLSNIFSIKARSAQTQKKGGILTGIGVGFMLGGAVAFETASEQKDSSFDITSGIYDAAGIGLMAIGGIMTGVGIITLTTSEDYKRSMWNYSIR